MYVHYGFTDASTKRWTFKLPKFDEPLSAWFHFWKIFWEPMSVGVKVIFLVEDDKTLYVPRGVGNSRWFYKRFNEEVDSHTMKI
jgi:hypothetical protein